VMTFLARRTISRWLNIVFGALFVSIKLAAIVGAASGGIARADGVLSPALIFNELWAIPAAAFIVWYAWREGTG